MRDERTASSDYMEWAKARQAARFTLALSGIKGMTRDELGVTIDDIALDGAVGYGHAPLLESLAAKSGVPVDRIVLAAGTSGGNHLALATLLSPGDEVVIETPCYEPLVALARYLGASVTFFPRRRENGFQIDPADLAAAVTARTRAVVISNLNNPAPVATDAGTMREIGAVADRVGATVLVDEVYLDAAFEAAPPSAARLGDMFVVTTSLTKVYGLGGLRAGWIVAEPGLARAIWRLKNLFGVNEAHPAERLAVVALSKSAAILARARAILDANRAVWHAFIAGRDDLDVEPVPIGTTSFPRVVGVAADRLCDHLRARYETSLVPGRFFGSPEHVRLGLCGDPTQFPEGVARLGQALDDLRGSG